ncbi:uncharacterized protein N7482_008802 [Penicillium canariense]|uniref:Uncharacterized protein n=1 Tax=Penicillium canariense TaxID=189055 RepID=A0A9W9HWL4_9EURO|nr:uncharacterized protein N7482_008802 [Penicillium canariense]KAJ5157702.1 hypothetical protein N7482_008802 [Penicillium canariense]
MPHPTRPFSPFSCASSRWLPALTSLFALQPSHSVGHPYFAFFVNLAFPRAIRPTTGLFVVLVCSDPVGKPNHRTEYPLSSIHSPVHTTVGQYGALQALLDGRRATGYSTSYSTSLQYYTVYDSTAGLGSIQHFSPIGRDIDSLDAISLVSNSVLLLQKPIPSGMFSRRLQLFAQFPCQRIHRLLSALSALVVRPYPLGQSKTTPPLHALGSSSDPSSLWRRDSAPVLLDLGCDILTLPQS